MTQREAQLSQELEQCQEALAAAQREIILLKQKIDLLARRIFGVSSEALSPAQLQLLLGLPELTATPAQVSAPVPELESAPKRSKRPRAPRIPDNLPVVEETIIPEAVKTEPEKWRCIGQEVSEQLDFEPGRFLRRRLVRPTFVRVHEQDQAPVTAPLPPCLQERCVAAPGLLAHVVVSKYCDHLPLYRQEQIFAQRYKINLPRQTLERWVELVADWLRPIFDEIRTGVMAGGYVQVDETPIEYLDPGNGKTRQGYLWTGCSPGGDVFYHWETSRAAACLDNVIPVQFNGTVQCDGYAAYRAFAADRNGTVLLAGCWAHARRKFYEARESAPRIAGWILRQIQHLYAIESRLRNNNAGPKLRAAVRAHQSRPIVSRLEKVLRSLKASRKQLPQSPLGIAVDYALGQWTTLQVYLEDGRIEIDNNLVENAIRPTALGKKNWLFIGEANAGQRSAIIYTVIESCRRRGIDPYAYLKDVLTRLPSMTNHQIGEITPAACGTSREKSLRRAS